MKDETFPNIKQTINIEIEKYKNKEYMKELERFFDLVDNIENESLKIDITYQMLRCDKILIAILQKELEK